MTLLTRLQQLFEGVLIAFDAIRSNKVRATLTILGIAVGVFVVTAMSAAVHGINAGVAKGPARRRSTSRSGRRRSTAATARRTAARGAAIPHRRSRRPGASRACPASSARSATSTRRRR